MLFHCFKLLKAVRFGDVLQYFNIQALVINACPFYTIARFGFPGFGRSLKVKHEDVDS